MGGTGIGSFSDRIRDPIRGGGPFDSGINHVQNQGFISGWFYAPNAENSGSNAERLALIEDSDNIRAWLAGGLASFRFANAAGTVVPVPTWTTAARSPATRRIRRKRSTTSPSTTTRRCGTSASTSTPPARHSRSGCVPTPSACR